MILAGTAAALAVLLLTRPAPARPPAQARDGWWLVLVPGALVAALVAGPLLAVAVLLALAARALLRQRQRRHRAAATSDRVLETCELLAAELSSGQPPAAALHRAAGTWSLLGPAAETAALGGDVAAALRHLATVPGAADLRLVAAGWEVAHRAGGGLADALDRVAGSVRADRATRRVVESELASARATARLVAVLPVLVMGIGTGTGGSPWTFLTTTPLGAACLVAGLTLALTGLWWIERLAAGVVR